MKQFSAEEKGFHGTIKAVVEIDEAKGQINKVWAENVTPNTIGAAGIATWLEKANQTKSVEIDAVSGASISTGALRKAAITAANQSKVLSIKENVDTISGASQSDSNTVKAGIPEPDNYLFL